ncbi:Hypothetical predicted protein [Octopus vulgaris]|uniref:Uncharacterized protein n=1 Tax=Octopus vulgaris TaxID=6645 RepID=A0AA36F9A4_OCTVU|nr:Hypothetical predicted protein [Octopus vulgaris]
MLSIAQVSRLYSLHADVSLAVEGSDGGAFVAGVVGIVCVADVAVVAGVAAVADVEEDTGISIVAVVVGVGNLPAFTDIVFPVVDDAVDAGVGAAFDADH